MSETAYYYPAPFWISPEADWIKSLLLFFDDVAILLPHYMYGRHIDADPTLAGPLEERGLLRVLEPKDWVDQEVTEKLAEVVVELLTNGAFDELERTDHFAELSQSRIGYGADADLAGFLVDELKARNLARPSQDGVSIPLHPTVRTSILVILAQLSRLAGKKRGMTIHPATDHPTAASDLIKTLSREKMPSRGKVIELDLEPVTFDLSSIPLDDVLQFRAEHRHTYRKYMRDLRGFMVELAEIDAPAQRETALLNRRQEIADAAHDIQRSTRTALGKNLASWCLGIAGSAWSFATADLLGLTLGALGIGAGILPGKSNEASAYTYIFETSHRFGNSANWRHYRFQ